MSTSLRTSARLVLESFAQSHPEEYTPEDVFRAFRDEATNLYQTERVRGHLCADPFERLKGGVPSDRLRAFCEAVRVTEYHKVVTKSGYVFIEASVKIDDRSSASSTESSVVNCGNKRRRISPSLAQLTFRYERHAAAQYGPVGVGTSVHYSIEHSYDHGPKEPMLWVDVVAASSTPSHLPAQSMQDAGGGDEDSFENFVKEMEGGEEISGHVEKGTSRVDEATTDSSYAPNGNNEAPQREEAPDRYLAGIDPDVLYSFLKRSNLGKIDDDVAFFLLMSFPFYELEWELVDFVLEEVFGSESDDENGGDGSGDNDDHADNQ